MRALVKHNQSVLCLLCPLLCACAVQIPATALQLAAKDRELRDLQEENSQLRQQVAEYEKAMQMASEYHAATQAAHQVGICVH